MATEQLSKVLQEIGSAGLRQNGGGLTDGQLLECFLSHRNEAAFEALVRRHGPMVLGVCRRVLAHAQDAEDAFQATFLVLARKAASVEPRELVGNFLYGVAYRTALDARTASARRRARERQVRDMPEPEATVPSADDDWRPVLDQELSRLPEKYRVPVVLCELEGRSRKDVAGQLAIPEGTLSSRLATARRMLAKRLARRGLALTAGALALGLSAQVAAAGVSVPLVTSTVKAATQLAAGAAARAVVSANVAALTEGVLKAMFLNKLKTPMAVLLAVGLLGAGVGLLALPRLAAQPAPNQPAASPAPARKDESAGKTPAEMMTKLYALPEGEVLKRVAPPFPPFRLEYYTQEYRDQAKLIPRGPTVMTFRWKDGKLTNWSMTFSGTNDDGVTLSALAEWLTGIYPQEIEGDEGLQRESINGDWVVREGTPAEKVIPRLEEILRRDCKLPIKLALRDVERKVVVAHGTYKHTPVPGYDKDDIQLYGKDLVPDSGAGGGSGTFQEFLQAAGAFMERRLVSEVKGAPQKVGWRYHKRSPFTEQEAKEDTDPDGVLKHLSEQTGLTFKEENRKVRVLFVERTPEQPK
jgi:RNA polymerase sigma factor (sigma-70 family)